MGEREQRVRDRGAVERGRNGFELVQQRAERRVAVIAILDAAEVGRARERADTVKRVGFVKCVEHEVVARVSYELAQNYVYIRFHKKFLRMQSSI